MADIYLDVWITRAVGGDLHLNDDVAFYVADGSFEDGAGTFRTSEAQSPFIDGTWVYNARKENETVSLKVYAQGGTSRELAVNLKALKDALSQPHFQVVRVLEDAKTTWTCFPSDWSVSSTRPLVHARKALLTSQLRALPSPLEEAYP